ncbi:transmembrane protein 6/97 [Kickxella alabastrina]|uniref:transmembrane protein 6/97 n=1 Tax=Kickxella alabastrina TaxID=61397 RepID=UPI00221EE536|nr:transmembrane protein 6/97 [Kickxella alabastrina]KAI7826702.1 transmembrane protein 6/97 [Kickxella alabastrina]
MPFSRAFHGRSWLDVVYFFYFVSHIPITVFSDAAPLLPADLLPGFMLELNRILTEQLSDPLMIIGATRSDMTWFRSMLTCELVLQLPFFFYAAYALWTNNPNRHAPLLVYGAHVSTTMAPVLGTLMLGDIDRTFHQRLLLLGLYLPYLLIPLSIVAVSFNKCAHALSVFNAKQKTS